MICVISRNLHPFFNSAHKCLSIPRVDTLDVCTSCISRCDQVAMLLINPSMRKDQSMPILIMLLHAVDHRVDTGVDAFLWKEIFVRIFLLRAILTNLGAMISFISGCLFQMENLPLYILFILVTFFTIFYCSTSFLIYYFLWEGDNQLVNIGPILPCFLVSLSNDIPWWVDSEGSATKSQLVHGRKEVMLRGIASLFTKMVLVDWLLGVNH